MSSELIQQHLPVDVPAFTASEVEARSGVPVATLRQWERRYGLPAPHRSSNGYRLYSLNDLQCVTFIRERIAEGVTAARAAELFRVLAVKPSSNLGAPLASTDLSQQLVAALLAADDQGSDRILAEAHAVMPVEDVLIKVVQPTLIAIGELWHDGQITVAHEHRASAYLEGHLFTLLNLAGRVRFGRSIIVACAPGEHHQIGALMLAIFVRRVGMTCHYLGANTPIDDIIVFAKQESAQAVLISCGSQQALAEVVRNATRLKAAAGLVAVGGAAVNDDPAAAEQAGLAVLGRDALEAVDELVGRLAS